MNMHVSPPTSNNAEKRSISIPRRVPSITPHRTARIFISSVLARYALAFGTLELRVSRCAPGNQTRRY